MKFVKLLKYVEDSFGGRPSFLILMSDGKEYISNGCVFVENTPKEIALLILNHECKEFLEELLNQAYSEECLLPVIRNSRQMFYGCKNIVEFDGDMNNVRDARHTFLDCKNLIRFNGGMKSVRNTSWMFSGCRILTIFKSEMPTIKESYSMFLFTPLENKEIV